MEETLGIDFDGVIRKFPRIIEWWASILSSNDLFLRSKLYGLRRFINYLCFDITPIILDDILITEIKRWPGRKILITGRYRECEKERLLTSLAPFVKFDKIIFREDRWEDEAIYKERICRQEHVDYFIEDKKYIIMSLRKHGINVISIRQLREGK